MSVPSYPVVPVEGIQSSLDGFIQPDPTRPWYTERASVIEYDLSGVPSNSKIVVELVVDRTKTGPFIPRSMTGLVSHGSNQTFGSLLAIRTGSAVRYLLNPFFFEINLAPSISNPLLYVPEKYPIVPNFQNFIIRVSNLPVATDRYENLKQDSYENSSFTNNWTGGSPVTIIDNYYGSSLFSSNLITAAGKSTLTSVANGLIRAIEVHIPENSTLATAGNNRIEIVNSDTSQVLWGATPYIPAALGSTERVYNVRFPSPLQYEGDLQLSIATAFTAGGVEVNAWG